MRAGIIKQEGESMRLVDPNPGGQGRRVQTQLSVDFESPGGHERRGPGLSLGKKGIQGPSEVPVNKNVAVFYFTLLLEKNSPM